MIQNIEITPELKQQVYDYHTDLHTNDKGYGGSIHKRVRERFNLTSDQVVSIIEEMKNPSPLPLVEDSREGFTGGKWEATNTNNSDFWDIDGDCRICSIDILALIDNDGSREEAEANARLISAAPDLLKAAIDTLKWLEINHRAKENEFFGELKAAINKATKQ